MQPVLIYAFVGLCNALALPGYGYEAIPTGHLRFLFFCLNLYIPRYWVRKTTGTLAMGAKLHPCAGSLLNDGPTLPKALTIINNVSNQAKERERERTFCTAK